MAATERIVIDADPSVKRKLLELAGVTGKSMKQLVIEYIENDWEKNVIKK